MGRSIRSKSILLSRRGQIAVEYTLLLAVSVIVAMLITKAMASRDPNNPGFLIVKWAQINEVIGLDYADDLSD